MSAHGITAEDTTVRGHPGTIARCVCGWSSAWGVRDGSAESDGHEHQMRNDPEALARHEERMAAWRAENKLRAAASAIKQPAKTEHSHNCSCHLGAPCGACENCKHPAGDFDDCPNDCQECEVEHDN